MKRKDEAHTSIMLKEGTKEPTNKSQCTAIEQSNQINLIDNLKLFLFFACNNSQEDIGNPILPLDVMGEIVKFTFPFEDIPTFLKLVVEGEQDQAEAMLKKNPALALCPGNVTDLSGRTFNNITGFQYAVWALDSYMWKMMLHTYLPKDAASEQIKGLETGSWVAKHGKSASWQNLIDALGELIKLYSARKFVAARRQWNGAVGKAQQQLPVHVVNQYCHPTRSFFPCPNFATEDTLPRNRKSDNGDWFVCSYNGGSIGNNCFAYYRGSQRGGKCGEGGEGGPISRILYSGYTFDLPALFTYLNHQTQLHNQLLSDLSSKSYSLKP